MDSVVNEGTTAPATRAAFWVCVNTGTLHGAWGRWKLFVAGRHLRFVMCRLTLLFCTSVGNSADVSSSELCTTFWTQLMFRLLNCAQRFGLSWCFAFWIVHNVLDSADVSSSELCTTFWTRLMFRLLNCAQRFALNWCFVFWIVHNV